MLKKAIVLLSLLGSTHLVLAATDVTPAEQTEMVAAHNSWRGQVGVKNLNWSSTLADSAQAWANSLRETQGCKMVHSKTKGVGENLYWASPLMYSDGTAELQAISATEVTATWGDEKKNYTYDSNSCAAGKVCGHYTQVVWKASTEVGCGKAICADKSQVWACQYSPAGNYVGQKPY